MTVTMLSPGSLIRSLWLGKQISMKGRKTFVGEITGVNIWNHVLDDKELDIISTSCSGKKGNVFKWSDIKKYTGNEPLKYNC